MRHRLHTRTAGELVALALAVLALAPASSSHASAAVADEPGFSLSCDPSRLSVRQGESGLTRCTVASANGFEAPAHLSCASPAPGLSCRFAPNPVAPVSDGTAESVLTIEVPPDAAPGDYTLQAQGTDGSNTAASDIDLVIHGPSPHFKIICTPYAFTIKQGHGAWAICGAYSYNGFSGPVSLSCAGQPVGVTCSFNPPTTFYQSELMVTVACGVATTNWTFQAVGTSGALTALHPILLSVTPWRECSG